VPGELIHHRKSGDRATVLKAIVSCFAHGGQLPLVIERLSA
jgi:hypothetical protein